MDSFSQRIASLSPEQFTLLRQYLDQKGKRSIEPPIRPQGRERNSFPLSFAQQRLWFLAQLDPDTPVYNETVVVQINGPLNVTALQQSLEHLVVQHEILRTVFTPLTSQLMTEPQQMILAPIAVSLPLVDLTNEAPCIQQTQSDQLIREAAQQPFDLASGPLMRATVIKWSDRKHLLALSMHHMVTDGWSIGVFLRQIGIFYNALSRHGLYTVTPLPIQYADFAVWQREWLQGEVLAKQLAYWKQQLADAPPFLALPTDRSRPAIQTFRGRREPLTLSKALTRELAALSQRAGATLFMTLLAAFQTLLYRYTAQEDILVGTAIANRNHKGLEDLIGFFVNTLVLRTKLTGSTTFLELLAEVREMALQAYAHQDTPFEKIVEVLQPERSLNHNPLFQVMFVLQNAPLGALKIGELELEVIPTDIHTAKRDLSLALTEGADGLTGHIEYNSDLFKATTIARMVTHFTSLLNAIVIDPEQRLADLTLLSPDEYSLLLDTWNPHVVIEPDPRLVHHLFEAQAEHTPDNFAVAFENIRLTYRQLNQKANQLAHYLQTLGVTSETLVPIYLERSVEMLVSILAILKAGAAYIPLDLLLPKQRLHLLLAEIGAPLLLSDSRLAGALPPDMTGMICLDQIQAVLSEQNQCNPVTPLLLHDNLAYVIYTSGSTGKPKGVAVAHRQLQNYVKAIINRLELSPGQSFLLVSTFASDLGHTVLFPSLVTGGLLHIITQERASDPAALADYLRQNRADGMKIVPSHLQVLLAHSRAVDIIPRRYLVLGGEICPWELVEKVQLLAPQCRIFNHYGPTETTVGVLAYSVLKERADDPPAASVPLGYPLDNNVVHILGPNMELVPIGVVGQLFIGGLGLARAYLHSPEQTAEKFIPDPFNTDTTTLGTRLYKTGDLGRYLEDGTIEFIGRIDQQVKVRGYRVELGEIEGILRQQPFLRESLVSLVTDATGEKKLVAYLVPDLKAQLPHIDAKDNDISSEQISQWQSVFEDTYRQNIAQIDPTFNLTGWNDSYTHQLLSIEEMKEWLEHTTARILALKPCNVLEIGCGTGLVLFKVAPSCKRYHGTDFSLTVIRNLQQVVSQLAVPLPQVTLAQANASNLQDVETGAFDTIILNSVVQYFPNLEFLVHVLQQCVRILDGQGAIFVGDIRHLALIEAFHLSVELASTPASSSLQRLRQAVHKRISQEQELLIAPKFFEALQHVLPYKSSFQLQLKRGRAHNELTKFRYDVVISVGSDNHVSPADDDLRLDWAMAALDAGVIHELLKEQQPSMLEISHVPDARIIKEIRAVEILHHENELTTVAELQARLQAMAPDGVEPEDFWELAQDLPYTVAVFWSDLDQVSHYNVRFTHKARTPSSTTSIETRPMSTPPDWDNYANNPLRGQFVRKLIPYLRKVLQENLPHYMMPSAFIVLDKLPLTANGKINYKLLPTPDRTRPEIAKAYVAPRNPIEQILASIFSQILDIERVGIHDDFFELGGHSLLATQVITQVRDTFRIDLPLRAMFESPTIAGLTELLLKHETQPNQAMSIARLRLQIKTMSIEQVRAMINQKKSQHEGKYL